MPANNTNQAPMGQRIRTALTTPPTFPADVPRLQTNLDTDLLKLVAILSMLVDHIGGAFFPEVGPFRWIGRLAFPIFCYCMTVGLLYTRNTKKYLARLAIFALISQPFYILATHPYDYQAEWMNMNIYFTLFFSLLAMTGVKSRKWWLFLLSFLILSMFGFDYSVDGVILMLIFYLCRNHPKLGALLFILQYLPALWNGSPADPRCLNLGFLCVNWVFFSLFAALLIFPRTHSGLKIPKYFFYLFYPAHLLVIGIIRLILQV